MHPPALLAADPGGVRRRATPRAPAPMPAPTPASTDAPRPRLRLVTPASLVERARRLRHVEYRVIVRLVPPPVLADGRAADPRPMRLFSIGLVCWEASGSGEITLDHAPEALFADGLLRELARQRQALHRPALFMADTLADPVPAAEPGGVGHVERPLLEPASRFAQLLPFTAAERGYDYRLGVAADGRLGVYACEVPLSAADDANPRPLAPWPARPQAPFGYDATELVRDTLFFSQCAARPLFDAAAYDVA